MIDEELMEALRKAFSDHLQAKQNIPAHLVINTLLTHAVYELSYALWINPEYAEETKRELMETFKELLDSVGAPPRH